MCGTVTMFFETFLLTILFENAKLNIKKKKKKATQVFQNFGSVGKGQTNIFLRLTVLIKVNILSVRYWNFKHVSVLNTPCVSQI